MSSTPMPGMGARIRSLLKKMTEPERLPLIVLATLATLSLGSRVFLIFR